MILSMLQTNLSEYSAVVGIKYVVNMVDSDTMKIPVFEIL
jgi:hypothetical protein